MHKMYLQPLLMFRQINCHPQGVFIKELQVLIASKYTIVGFTVEVFTQLTVLKYTMHELIKLKLRTIIHYA
jgi:hypothetical protein